MYNTELLINEITKNIIPNISKYETMGFKIYLKDDFIEICYNNKQYLLSIYNKNKNKYWLILHNKEKYYINFNENFETLLLSIKNNNFLI